MRALTSIEQGGQALLHLVGDVERQRLDCPRPSPKYESLWRDVAAELHHLLEEIRKSLKDGTDRRARASAYGQRYEPLGSLVNERPRLLLADLVPLAVFLFGARWQTALAGAVHRSPRMVRRWAADERPISAAASASVKFSIPCWLRK